MIQGNELIDIMINLMKIDLLNIDQVANGLIKLYDDMHNKKVNNGEIMLIDPVNKCLYVELPKFDLIGKLEIKKEDEAIRPSVQTE